MVMRNITWRLTQRFACSCKIGVPFAFSRPGDRDSDFLKACGFRKPRPVGPRLSQPAFVEQTIQSARRRAGEQQHRDRKFLSEQGSLFQRLPDRI